MVVEYTGKTTLADGDIGADDADMIQEADIGASWNQWNGINATSGAKQSQSLSRMDSRGEALVDDSPEDIRWLCNLSESELDMLIRLKALILHRANVLGHDELAKKFDLLTLRAVGLFLMDYLKGKVKDLSNVQGLSKLAEFPDWCNLLRGNPGDDSSVEELKASIVIDERKIPIKRYGVSQSAVFNDSLLSNGLFWSDSGTLLIILASLASQNSIGGDA
ncbi:hypothetical protein SADUNF_Sadunf03G0113800 [Salix dunnii]|uniref:Uncharacterized protein n=1 Tax=Salix dunnii TaxID=1413687 RepID=A0A835KF74_9ROSI|nr:hypothetical protein SADUNF_Sadunf03G0113800 [Salix dunnii]